MTEPVAKKEKAVTEYQEVKASKRSATDEDLDTSDSLVEKDISVDSEAADTEKAREGILAGQAYLDKLTNDS